MKKWIFLMAIGSVVFSLGCEKQMQLEETMPICLNSVSMDHLFAAAESVLEEMQFQIDKADRETGQIITRPLRGGQFFELWRQDNTTATDTLESSIQSLQRIAEIRFDWTDNMACANCRVYVQRLSVPEQPLAGTSMRSSMLTNSSGTLQRLRMNPQIEEQVEWIYLGDDPALEQVILKKVQRAVSRGGGA